MTPRVLALTAVAFFSLSMAAPVAAVHYGLHETADEAGYGAGEKQLEPLINRAIRGFLALLAIFFLGLMLYAGIRWLTARGQEDLIGKAQHTLQAAVIGLGIVLAAYAITSFVLDFF